MWNLIVPISPLASGTLQPGWALPIWEGDNCRDIKAHRVYNPLNRFHSATVGLNAKVPDGFADHHLISPMSKHTRFHELLHCARFDIHSRANRMLLPITGQLHPTRSIHRGRHQDEVGRSLCRGMHQILQVGQQRQWTAEQYGQALRRLLCKERAQLRSGHRALNRVKRLWAL